MQRLFGPSPDRKACRVLALLWPRSRKEEQEGRFVLTNRRVAVGVLAIPRYPP